MGELSEDQLHILDLVKDEGPLKEHQIAQTFGISDPCRTIADAWEIFLYSVEHIVPLVRGGLLEVTAEGLKIP